MMLVMNLGGMGWDVGGVMNVMICVVLIEVEDSGGDVVKES